MVSCGAACPARPKRSVILSLSTGLQVTPKGHSIHHCPGNPCGLPLRDDAELRSPGESTT